MVRWPLLAILALPLSAEPIFNLYECRGQEAGCLGMFPGEPAMRDGGDDWRTRYVLGGRAVVNGYDLGEGRDPFNLVERVTYLPLYHRGSVVVGWRYEGADYDDDGSLVKWLLGGNGESTILAEGGIFGSSPGIIDINSSGVAIGGSYGGPITPMFYDTEALTLENLRDEEMWRTRIAFFRYTTNLLRINDDGQVLATTMFWGENGETEERLILLSPVGTPVTAIIHNPEPSTLVYLSGFWLLVGAYLWRKRGAEN
jgi:hypothetical protein